MLDKHLSYFVFLKIYFSVNYIKYICFKIYRIFILMKTIKKNIFILKKEKNENKNFIDINNWSKTK
jgi:hypothetical protein